MPLIPHMWDFKYPNRYDGSGIDRNCQTQTLVHEHIRGDTKTNISRLFALVVKIALWNEVEQPCNSAGSRLVILRTLFQY
jgi:hypothetical protein